jgi:hypothetical protein
VAIDPNDRRLCHKPEEKWQEETSKKIREWNNLAEPLTKNMKKKRRTRKVDPTQPLIKNCFTMERNEAVPKNT